MKAVRGRGCLPCRHGEDAKPDILECAPHAAKPKAYGEGFPCPQRRRGLMIDGFEGAAKRNSATMIQRVPAGADARQFTWLLAPNRALSRDELRKAIGVLAAAAMLTALLAAWQGNVFAPLFALLEVP